ncbi:hypothetical protein DDB_G0279687 [Dictyostelium discoideum AX4]|uniref:Uncharacterized protein DDB_G0279687 n=1 Tax=Dictyostelium discoideum TaxID=44689 RepID=Y0598_DICDI|nr:hypothetical protein DDB_G0279687 [Dictyostelium discoideum AX4]Q54WF3.1 RecName: Full=Uncharacterized protein DDB_G0279687 [Dictyostelium discoideum]EAL67618.1 hypothetical protein DDB_G0279687 [Dictyostelium discoideum AX4]|eukprot:XP_641600.1 hypothetical protein DDB_G0279687 [Dictyostelium discoideum AX4]
MNIIKSKTGNFKFISRIGILNYKRCFTTVKTPQPLEPHEHPKPMEPNEFDPKPDDPPRNPDPSPFPNEVPKPKPSDFPIPDELYPQPIV